MKIATLLRVGQRSIVARWFALLAITGLLLGAASLKAQTPTETKTTVTTLGGGPQAYNPGSSFGYSNSVWGVLESQFHTPSGLAYDGAQDYLYVADRNNNAIRLIDNSGEIFTFAPYPPYIPTNLISQPVGVAVDALSDVFVLNRGKGNNGTVMEFDWLGNLIATNMTKLTNATGIALDTIGNIYVTASNTVFKISPAGVSNIVATITAPGASLQGIVVKRSGPTAGLLAVCDSGRNGILLINPNTGIVTTNAGFNGVGDGTGNRNQGILNVNAQFFQPSGLAEAGDGSLIVADFGNDRVKVVTVSGITTNLYGVASNDWWTGTTPPPASLPAFLGWSDGAVWEPDGGPGFGNVQARMPFGVAIGPDGTVYTTEDYYHIIRKVTGANIKPPLPWPPAAPTILTVTTNFGQVTLTWSTVPNATGYNVERAPSSGGPYAIIATNITATTFTDTTVVNGTTYYYVVSALNAGGESANSAEVSAAAPIPPPPPPRIGWFDYEGIAPPLTVLHQVSGANYYTANNNLLIAIDPTTNGLSTHYITTNVPQSVPLSNSIVATGSTPPAYQDGQTYAQSLTPGYVSIMPDLVIEAVNIGPGGTSSVAMAEFRFQVGTPTIIGDNAADFTNYDVTIGAQLWYTTDGSIPDPTTNAAASQLIPGTITGTNGITFRIPFPANSNMIMVTVRGFRDGYSPSDASLPKPFYKAAYHDNTISFGFAPDDPVAQGEASSIFVGSPGQTFYAPVTMSVLSGTKMYSLQFNVTVANTNVISPAQVASGTIGFRSMLVQPIPPPTNFPPGVSLYATIPPYMFIANETGPVPPNSLTNYNGTNFVILEFVTNNLLGVGWLERYTQTNLYNTLSQDLIQFSMAHDDVFKQGDGDVIVGGYSFQVPANAGPNDAYQIQLGRPSATDDGIGAPGSSVFIATPTNGSLAGGAINSIKIVTLGQLKYIAGDSAPFRWFNAGDFGNTNLDNSDAEQVFQSAIYQFNKPPAGSDFFDAMDSSGNLGSLDNDLATPNFGYYTNSNPNNIPADRLTLAQQNALFNGNDLTINTNIFGDGILDVCDVYVTFRRSLNTNLVWFQRFWTNGVRVAVATNAFITPSVAFALHGGGKFQPAVNPNLDPVSITNTPSVNFAGGDFQVAAGQTIQIPVTASVFGQYPLRVAMLNISVVPLDGSPALTTPISFSPFGTNTALGAPNPLFIDSHGPGNYAAAWLDSTITGISNGATIGTLNVTIPANATSLSAYAIHFDHASGSPNGLASLPKHTLTGLITLSSRNTSSYGDGIPDSWRLRWFGTVNNELSRSNNCPSGDGINNWKKYVAGVDPSTPNDFPSLNPNTPPPSGAVMSIYWPTVSGKHYAILSSASLFPGNWTTNATITGTGANMEFDDNSTGPVKFYRVLILP